MSTTIPLVALAIISPWIAYWSFVALLYGVALLLALIEGGIEMGKP